MCSLKYSWSVGICFFFISISVSKKPTKISVRPCAYRDCKIVLLKYLLSQYSDYNHKSYTAWLSLYSVELEEKYSFNQIHFTSISIKLLRIDRCLSTFRRFAVTRHSVLSSQFADNAALKQSLSYSILSTVVIDLHTLVLISRLF